MVVNVGIKAFWNTKEFVYPVRGPVCEPTPCSMSSDKIDLNRKKI